MSVACCCPACFVQFYVFVFVRAILSWCPQTFLFDHIDFEPVLVDCIDTCVTLYTILITGSLETNNTYYNNTNY